jgi:hypothetical protein
MWAQPRNHYQDLDDGEPGTNEMPMGQTTGVDEASWRETELPGSVVSSAGIGQDSLQDVDETEM